MIIVSKNIFFERSSNNKVCATNYDDNNSIDTHSSFHKTEIFESTVLASAAETKIKKKKNSLSEVKPDSPKNFSP